MKRVASLVAVLIIIVLMSPPAVVAAVESDNHTCTCRPMTTDCAQCGTGRCCSDFGYCGSLVGYCTPCNCASDDGTTYVCNPCNCLGGCPDPEPDPDPDPFPDPDPPEPPEPDHDRDDEKMLLIDATYDQNLDNKASSSEYGCAAVCGPPASNVSTAHNNIIAAGQCLLVTNYANGKQAMVRIIRSTTYCKGTGGNLALDYHVFRKLDAGGDGNPPGGRRLRISYSYVKCYR